MPDRDTRSEITRIGSRACGIACAFLGVILALLLLYAGFWRTLFVALLAAAGYFLGGVSDKKTFVRDTVNRIVPEKNQPEPPVANAEKAQKILQTLEETETEEPTEPVAPEEDPTAEADQPEEE